MVDKPIIRIFTPSTLSIGWDWRNVGYGEITIDSRTNQIEIFNNNLTKDEVRLILHRFVDYAIDHGVFVENRND